MSKFLLVVTLLVMCYHMPVKGSYTYNYNYYRRYAPSTVAFSVAKNTNQEFTEADTVEFEKVLTNVGKAFKMDDNKVKIPTTGLYYISYFAPGQDAEKGNVNLVKNDNVVVSSMGDNGANAVVLFLEKGDRLCLQGEEGAVLESNEDNRKVTFSGFLIKRGFFNKKY